MFHWSNEDEFWALVVRHGLPRFRFFRRSAALAELETTLHSPEWQKLRALIQPGDKIWPFCFPGKRRYWGNKYGYVVLRRGKFVGGIVTVSE
jgi:hypothetical protein